MWGSKQYALAATALSVLLAAVYAALFVADGRPALVFAALGWGPIALVGVVGGTVAVRVHGRVGLVFPTVVLTCILLRLIFGLGGLPFAVWNGQVTPYLTGLFATFVALLLFESIWFLFRLRVAGGEAERDAQAIG